MSDFLDLLLGNQPQQPQGSGGRPGDVLFMGDTLGTESLPAGEFSFLNDPFILELQQVRLDQAKAGGGIVPGSAPLQGLVGNQLSNRELQLRNTIQQRYPTLTPADIDSITNPALFAQQAQQFAEGLTPEEKQRIDFARATGDFAIPDPIAGNPIFKMGGPLGLIQIPQQSLIAGINATTQFVKEGVPGGFEGFLRFLATNESQIEFGKFANPFATPDEYLSFQDTLKEIGLPESTFVRTTGFFADLFLDPLFLPATLRLFSVGGRFPKLLDAADKVESILAPAFAFTNPVSKGVLNASDFALGKVLEFLGLGPGSISQRTIAGTSAVLNRELPFSVSGKRLTIGDFLVSEGRNPLAPGLDFSTGGAGLPEELLRAAREGQTTVNNLLDFTGTQIANIYAALGEKAATKLFNNLGKIVQGTRSLNIRVGSIPDIQVRDAIFNLAADTVNSEGIIFDAASISELDKLRTTPLANRETPLLSKTVGDEIREMQGAFAALGGKPVEVIFQDNLAKVRDLARKSPKGIDPDVAEAAYRDVVTGLRSATAAIGYHASLFPYVKEAVYNAAIRLGLNANGARGLWIRSLAAVLHNEDFSSVKFRISPTGDATISSTGTMTLDDLFEKTTLRAGGFDFRKYVIGVRDGHLRQVYATLATDKQIQSYAKNLAIGDFIPNTLIDTPQFVTDMTAKGKGAEAALIQDYIQNISPSNKLERGFIVRQANLARFLKQQGFNNTEVQGILKDMIETLNPGLELAAVNAEEFAMSRQQARVGPTGREIRTFDPEGFNPDLQAVLGKTFEASLNLGESAMAAASSFTLRDYLSRVFEFARDSDLVGRRVSPDSPLIQTIGPAANVINPTEDFVLLSGRKYGIFDGLYVHRFLARSIDNAFVSTPRGRAVSSAQLLGTTATKVRSRITGGFLANPKTIVANVLGGFYTAAEYGINPVALAREMVGVAIDWKKLGNDLPEFRAAGDLLQGGLAVGEMRSLVDFSRAQAIPTSGADLPNFINSLGDIIKNGAGAVFNLKRPFGIPFVGLEAFEYTENLFKLGAYRLAIKQGKSELEAYRLAKNVVFDYTSIPESLSLLQETGLLLFPGFGAFSVTRAINGAINKPAALAAGDRLADALFNAQIPDEDIKSAVIASMSNFMNDGRYVVVRGDDKKLTFLSSNRFVVVDPLTNNPIGESLVRGGLYQPLFDIAAAINTGTGEAPISQAFGGRVFDPKGSTATRLGDTVKFLYNSVAPGYLRTLGSFDIGVNDVGNPRDFAGGFVPSRGLIPGIAGAILRPGEGLGATIDEINSQARGRTDKDLYEELLSAFIGGTQSITMTPVMNRALRGNLPEMRDAQRRISRLTNQISDAQVRITIAIQNGDVRAKQRAERDRDRFLAERASLQRGMDERRLTILRGVNKLSAGAEIFRPGLTEGEGGP